MSMPLLGNHELDKGGLGPLVVVVAAVIYFYSGRYTTLGARLSPGKHVVIASGILTWVNTRFQFVKVIVFTHDTKLVPGDEH